MSNKRLLFLIIILNIPVLLLSQDVKYKDLMEMLPKQSDITKHNMLKAYQQQDPYHANTYYQLANVAYRLAQTIDPLKQYEEYNYFARHTEIYLGLCRNYLDSRNMRQQRDYYKDIELPEDARKVEEEHVRAYIKQQLKEVKSMRNDIDNIYKYFNASINNYTKSNSLFRKINGSFSKIKNIYLKADNQLISDINKVEKYYDSTVYYLNAFQKALKKRPIQNYNQQYQVLPIITYRLEGLTTADFFNNTFNIWNYRAWTDSLLTTIQNPVVKLREDIRVQQKLINEEFNKLKYAQKKGKKINPFRVDEKLTNRIGKYDFNSMVVNLFNYEEDRINYWAYGKLGYNSTARAKSYPLQQRCINYYNLYTRFKSTQKKYNIFINNITDENIEKYEDFIKEEFGNSKNFINTLKTENKEDKRFFKGALINLKKFTENTIQPTDTTTTKCKKYDIPVQIGKAAIKTNGIAVKTNEIERVSSYRYIAGYIIPQKDTLKKAFLAKITDSACVWIKTYKNKTQQTTATNIETTDNGCRMIISTKNDTGGIANTHYKIDHAGKTIEKVNLTPDYLPVYFNYDEINQNYIIAYQKTAYEAKQLDTLRIELRNDTIENAIWTKSIALKGNLIEIIKTNEDYLVFCNYGVYEHYMGEIRTAHLNNSQYSSLFSYYIDKSGKILHHNEYSFDESAYGVAAYKINSETINILGLFDKPDFSHQIYNFDRPLLYMLTNRYGELIEKVKN